jgi:hypothetical protein
MGDLHYLQYADLIAPPDLSGGSFGKLERAYGEYKAAVERQTYQFDTLEVPKSRIHITLMDWCGLPTPVNPT